MLNWNKNQKNRIKIDRQHFELYLFLFFVKNVNIDQFFGKKITNFRNFLISE